MLEASVVWFQVLQAYVKTLPSEGLLTVTWSIAMFTNSIVKEKRSFSWLADWMNLSGHRQIEVSFPNDHERLRKELLQFITIQIQDNVQAVQFDENVPVTPAAPYISSQRAIYSEVLGRKLAGKRLD